MCTVEVLTPWGPDSLGPNLGARAFAWAHYRAGHRYTVTRVDGLYSILCECGAQHEPGSTTITYP